MAGRSASDVKGDDGWGSKTKIKLNIEMNPQPRFTKLKLHAPMSKELL